MPAPESRQEDIAPLLRLGLEEGLTASDPDQTLLLKGTTPTGKGSKKSSGCRWNPPSLAELQHALPNYEIAALVACGGMGAVYKGTQVTLMRDVAVKVLPPDILNDDDDGLEFVSRFKREAQAMARLKHPNIVTVYDAGHTPEGLLYFVMEFIDGTDVAQLIASEGRVAKERAVEIITAVCDALAYAHAEGIVHRDIKPSNVMIDRKGVVKVADFGLAKALNRETTALTRTNVAMGTPDYMAPETTIPGIQVDGRADIYAVGVMLYQMLTGKVPRGRFEPASGMVPRLDRRFDAIVDKAMQTDREKRYSTAIEMKRAIERATTASIMTSWRQTSSVPVPARPSRRLLWLAIGAAAVMSLSFLIYQQMTRHSQTTVAVKSAGAATQPLKPPAPAEAGWGNLVPLIDPMKNALSGEWTVKDGELVYPHKGNDNRGAVEIPVDYDGGNYDLRIGFTRADTVHQSMSFSFRKGTTGGSVLFDLETPGGLKMAGLEYDRDTTMMNFKGQWPAQERDWLPVNQRHTLLLQVRDEGLRAELNGKEVFRWTGNWSNLKQGRGLDKYLGEVDHLPIFGLGLILGSVTYHSIEMRTVMGTDGEKLPAIMEPKVNLSAKPDTVEPTKNADAWTNLFEKIDPAKPLHKGLWVMKDGELHLELSANLGTFDLPVDYDGGNYDLRVRLTRTGNHYRSTAIAFRKGTTGGTIIFDMSLGAERDGGLLSTGLASLINRTTQDLGGLCPPGAQRITPGPHTILLQVRDEGLSVSLDDHEVFRWKGDWSQLQQGLGEDRDFTKVGTSAQTKAKNRGPIFRLGTMLGGAVFHRVEFRRVPGEEGRQLEPVIPPAAIQ